MTAVDVADQTHDRNCVWCEVQKGGFYVFLRDLSTHLHIISCREISSYFIFPIYLYCPAPTVRPPRAANGKGCDGAPLLCSGSGEPGKTSGCAPGSVGPEPCCRTTGTSEHGF